MRKGSGSNAPGDGEPLPTAASTQPSGKGGALRAVGLWAAWHAAALALLLGSAAFSLPQPKSITPDPKWTAQAAEDAKQDFKSIPYDGITPNKMVCDTTLRELPDGSWIISMLAGDDFEPSPQNYLGITRSTDQSRTWTPLEAVDTTFPRSGLTAGDLLERRRHGASGLRTLTR